MADELVPALQDTLNVLKESPYPPSMREMGERLGISATAVQNRLRALRAVGLIEIPAGQHRGVRLTCTGRWVFVPGPVLVEVEGLIAGWEARQAASERYEGEAPL
jgi:biotin operon repressor